MLDKANLMIILQVNQKLNNPERVEKDHLLTYCTLAMKDSKA
jgi:hypothetical protein